MTSSQPATKDDLRSSTHEIIEHFNKGQSEQNSRLDRIENRLDQVAEDVSKIKLEVLKRQGIPLNESDIFRA